jgi:hypothetical protein
LPTPRPRPRRRGLGLGVAAAFALAAAVAAALAVETRPRAEVTPDAATARAALEAGATLRGVVEAGAAAERLTLGAAEIDALLAAAGRLAPGVAATARLDPGPVPVTLTLSLGPPRLPAPFWANVELGLVAGPDGLGVAHAALGRLPLPPALVGAALARGLDRALGAPGLGREAMAGVTGLAVADGRLELVLGADAAARGALIERLRVALGLGGADGPVYAHLWWLNRDGAAGALPRAGSLVPWLRHVVERSGRMGRRFADVPDRDRLAAGFVALAIYCGEPALGPAVGVRLKEHMQGDANHCADLTLGGRDDLKRHFTVSAGLVAASSGPAAWGVGELKELVDSGEGGSGFGFDDMAANLAGARFAEAFLAVPKADWPALLARVGDEADVLPETGDLPRGLDEAAFRARFGDLDGPAYRAAVAEIERRVDALPLHRPIAP